MICLICVAQAESLQEYCHNQHEMSGIRGRHTSRIFVYLLMVRRPLLDRAYRLFPPVATSCRTNSRNTELKPRNIARERFTSGISRLNLLSDWRQRPPLQSDLSEVLRGKEDNCNLFLIRNVYAIQPQLPYFILAQSS